MPEWLKSYVDVNYMGGHVEYPKPRRCGIDLYDDHLSIYFEKKSFFGDRFEKKPTLIISYQSMANIENANEDRIRNACCDARYRRGIVEKETCLYSYSV